MARYKLPLSLFMFLLVTWFENFGYFSDYLPPDRVVKYRAVALIFRHKLPLVDIHCAGVCPDLCRAGDHVNLLFPLCTVFVVTPGADVLRGVFVPGVCLDLDSTVEAKIVHVGIGRIAEDGTLAGSGDVVKAAQEEGPANEYRRMAVGCGLPGRKRGPLPALGMEVAIYEPERNFARPGGEHVDYVVLQFARLALCFGAELFRCHKICIFVSSNG